MSNYICFFVLILASVIFTNVSPQNYIRKYAIHRDIFSGFKAAEFTVFDTSEKHVHYRIESDYGITQNVKVIEYPSKQEVGRLQARFKLLLYTAEISILNPETNRWINGLIDRNFKFLGSLFDVKWNGHRIIMKSDAFWVALKFFDEDQEFLAEIRLRRIFFLKAKYDMKIYSNKYPESIYLLGFAAHQHVISTPKKG